MKKDARVKDTVFCAFDLETTGVSPYSRIVEIAGVLFCPGGEEKTFSTLVNPGVRIPAEVTAIHGITDRMVDGFPDAAAAMEQFFGFVGDSVLLAHNARFDTGILSTSLARCNMTPPDNHAIDTVRIARRFFPGLASYSLGRLSGHLGLAGAGVHRALPDALAVRKLFELALEAGDSSRMKLGELISLAGVKKIGEIESTRRVGLSPGQECIQEAIRSRSRLVMVYQGGTRGPSPREVTPVVLFRSGSISYLEAYCHIDGKVKSFRLDRILQVVISRDGAV